MGEATRMLMKSHAYFRTKMLYLTDNDYKNYDIKGSTATNDKSHKQDSPTIAKPVIHEGKRSYIEI